MWTHEFLSHSVVYNPLLSLFSLMLNLSKIWPWCPFRLALLSFVTCSHHFWGTLLFSDTVKYSRLMLSFPYSSPEISCFSKEPWFILAENSIKKLSLGTKCTYCYRGFIASRTSQCTELGRGEYVCTSTHTCICTHTRCHMHTCRCLFVHLSV